MAGIGRYLLRGLGVGSDIAHFVLTGLAPTGVLQTISPNPSSVPVNSTTTVTVTGTGTTWNSVGPSFSFSGVAGLSITSTTVIDDTHATIVVVAGAAFGAATLTDATSGASCPFTVTAAPVVVSPAPAPTGLIESDGTKGGYTVPVEWVQRQQYVPPPAKPIQFSGVGVGSGVGSAGGSARFTPGPAWRCQSRGGSSIAGSGSGAATALLERLAGQSVGGASAHGVAAGEASADRAGVRYADDMVLLGFDLVLAEEL